MDNSNYYKTCLKGPLKNRQNKGLKDKLSLNEGRKYCRMLYSILLTGIKCKPFFGLLFEWPLSFVSTKTHDVGTQKSRLKKTAPKHILLLMGTCKTGFIVQVCLFELFILEDKEFALVHI